MGATAQKLAITFGPASHAALASAAIKMDSSFIPQNYAVHDIRDPILILWSYGLLQGIIDPSQTH